MTTPGRIYIDNAATSWPKPECVYEAVEAYQRHNGAPAGRGAYGRSLAASQLVEQARRAVATLLHAEDPRSIAFGFNGTDALNMALHGILRGARRVVTTAAEHNSVLRPLHAWRAATGGELVVLPCVPSGVVDLDAAQVALATAADLLAVTHASNVTGAIQPVGELGELGQRAGAVVLLDAAQTVGHLPIDLSQLPVDLLAASGHKGLLGPLGTGLLYVRPGVEARLAPFRRGGTGTQSERTEHPAEMPHRLEAGNHNVPGLAGLAAGVAWLQEHGKTTAAEQQRLTALLLAVLKEQNGVTVYGPAEISRRVGVLSFNIRGFDPQEAAAILDGQYGIECRSGLHCAPRMHESLGTSDAGGTVRLSLGPFNSDDEVKRTLEAVAEIARV